MHGQQNIKTCVATFDTELSFTYSTKSIASSFQKLLDCTVQLAEHAAYGVDVPGETIKFLISLCLTLDILNVMCKKDKRMLAFNFIFDLLWTNRSALVRSSVPFLKFPELK